MTVPMMTNLEPSVGWTHVPCVNMLSTEVSPSHPWIMIDDADRRDDAILKGDQHAKQRAADALAALRVRCPRSRIGWYGWPYPLDSASLPKWVEHVAPLMQPTDVAFHCCYSAGDGGAVDRAALARDCLAEFWPGDKPIVACVCDSFIHPVDFGGGIKRSMCRDEDMREQVEAARAALADSLYVWSGLPYRLWLMGIWRQYPQTCNDAERHPGIYADVRRGRDELLNLYGFVGDPLDAKSCASQARKYTQNLLAKFARLWKETSK